MVYYGLLTEIHDADGVLCISTRYTFNDLLFTHCKHDYYCGCGFQPPHVQYEGDMYGREDGFEIYLPPYLLSLFYPYEPIRIY